MSLNFLIFKGRDDNKILGDDYMKIKWNISYETLNKTYQSQ